MRQMIVKAPIYSISRLRFGTDGKGITSLVAFMGCPLRCRHCINRWCHSDPSKARLMTPEDLYGELMIDDIYFQMTGGGVCFGGGEPTLYPEFIRQFRKVCGSRWRITVETALTCTEDVIPEMARSIDRWIVDVKDLSEEIYEEYTGKRNDIRSKLRVLLDAGAETTVRVPHILGYNSDADVARTIAELRSMGFNDIDEFTYITK